MGYLESNKLSGTIPAEIGNLINLEELILESNKLSGTIPAEIGNLINLSILILSSNELSGSIPEGIDNLNLGGLDLHDNKLSGIIPQGIKKFVGVIVNISKNYFTKENDIPNRWTCDDAFRIAAQLEEVQTGM